jgi:drug/metabolite transporter (DMT)-like permease
MKKETFGTFLAIVTALFSGLAIPMNKLFVVDLDPTVFTAIRGLIIGIIFYIIFLFEGKSNPKKSKIHWKYLLSIAIIGGSFAFLLFFTGLKLTTAGRGAFLHKTLPFYITILAFIFLREKVNKKQALALFIMLLGTVLIYFDQIEPAEFWLNPSMGDLLIIVATILWAIESIIAKKAMINGDSNYIVSFARMFIGSIILFAIIILQDKMNLLLSLTLQQTINIVVSTAILFGYVFCWYYSIKMINVSKASTLLLLAPIISLIFGVLIFNEPAPNLQLLGSLLILIGTYIIVKVKSEFVTGI